MCLVDLLLFVLWEWKVTLGRGPWLCRNSWETFGGEKLPGLWNKVVSAVASQCVCYLLPERQLMGCDCAAREARTGGQLAFPEWQLISQRERQWQHTDNVGRERAGCWLRTVAHLSWEGWFFFFWRRAVKLEVLLQGGSYVRGGGWRRLPKSIFTVLSASFQLPKEVCFPSIAEN